MSPSRTSTCTSSLGCACGIAIALAACRQTPNAIAELASATGPVERQDTGLRWEPAKLGTRYFLGDAARTWDGEATLAVGRAGGAQIVMKPRTTLRFGGKPGQSKIAVELGTIDLSGNGSYALDIGDVKLDGKVRISKENGTSSVELTLGAGQVARDGSTVALEIGKSVDVARDGSPPADAGVRDARPAPADAAIDAAEDAATAVGDATIEVTGSPAELLAPGQTAWAPLPAGAGSLAPGSAVRVGAGTTARVTAGGATLGLAGGARMKLGEDLVLALEAGPGTASATGPAAVALPGGAVALTGAPRSEARLDAGPRETRVTIQRGGSKLSGAPGSELTMSRGESASLTRGGAIRVLESIPTTADFRVPAGESFTIHDPGPPAAVQFQFDGKCPEGGIIELDRDARFRAPKVSAGHDVANLRIAPGAWSYRLRCTSNGAEGAAVASGRLVELRDDGRRPLPRTQSVNDIDADGRNYRISYQSAIPNIVVHVRNSGAAHKLHLATGGREQTFDSSTPAITVPGTQLREGTYTYWVDRDGVKQDKVSTLAIDFDQTAPQVYIESPAEAQAWPDDIDVRGAVLPGWSAAVEAVPIPIDRQRRFSAKVGKPTSRALAIQLSHPQRGIHYYLRRPRSRDQ
ncbi:MAG: hypothetical protein E6J91_03540 [Deltaproteobacteria bacterium]|nr:MAG: hypothetical protein E6J91_03540 [Deltaproteobacteria bacterium]